MQIYKSSGNIERASKFYSEYSQVPDSYKIIKDIVQKKKKPGALKIFSNTLIPWEDTHEVL
jgi:hypothetical protein